MTLTTKTLKLTASLAALLTLAAGGASAMDMATMTCADFMAMSAEDQAMTMDAMQAEQDSMGTDEMAADDAMPADDMAADDSMAADDMATDDMAVADETASDDAMASDEAMATDEMAADATATDDMAADATMAAEGTAMSPEMTAMMAACEGAPDMMVMDAMAPAGN